MTAPLRAILSMLERGERVVTAVGAPGPGRSALARQVAARWTSDAGAAAVADLSGARDATEVADATAAALDVWPCDGEGPTDPLLAVAQSLASRGPLLLVLDGFDELSDFAYVTVLRWRDLAPTLQMVVFCGAPLGLSDEVVVDLGALDGAAAAPAERATAPADTRMRAWEPAEAHGLTAGAGESAVERAAQRLAAARASGEPRAVGECAWFLALARHREGALDLGLPAYADAELAAATAGQPWIAACARVGAGALELEQGRIAEARAILGRAEATITGFDPRMEGILLALLGAAKARLGELVDAGWLLDRAERLLQSVDVALLATIAGPLRGQLDLERAARARVSGDTKTADELEHRARERLHAAITAGDPDPERTRPESLATTVWVAATRLLGASLETKAPN